MPRQTAYAWVSETGRPARIVDVYQPAGRMEEFFREVGKYSGGSAIHEVMSFDEFRGLFREHGMEVMGPPLAGKWNVEDGRIVQVWPPTIPHEIRTPMRPYRLTNAFSKRLGNHAMSAALYIAFLRFAWRIIWEVRMSDVRESSVPLIENPREPAHFRARVLS